MIAVIIVVLCLLIVIYFVDRFRPSIDITKEGEVLLWYNYHYYNQPNSKWFVSRQYYFLFKFKK